MDKALVIILLLVSSLHAQVARPHAQILAPIFQAPSVSAATPTLAQFMGKNIFNAPNGRAATSANGVVYSLDAQNYPNGVTPGSLVIMSGKWPDHPTTVNSWAQNCTAPCAPTFTDNGTGNTWIAGPSCTDAQSIFGTAYHHAIYYSQNFTPPASGTPIAITETHTNKIAQFIFNPSSWYNVLTSSAVGQTWCTTGQTPANNTAPNISSTSKATTVGSIIYGEIDNESEDNTINTGGNAYSSITVPSNCFLLDENIYDGIIHFYCNVTSTSFTPTFTVAQSVHDTFTIMAVEILPGSSGSTPTAGASILLSAQFETSQAATYTLNLGCPTTTNGLVVTDDARNISAVKYNTTNSLTLVASNGEIFFVTGITVASPNTFTVTVTTGGLGNDIVTMYCVKTSGVDTGLVAGSGATQVTTSVVQATGTAAATPSTGGSLTTCPGAGCAPNATPGVSGDLLIGTGGLGTGPALSCTTTGCVNDFPAPTLINACSVTTAGICGGDIQGMTNGDTGFHFWEIGSTAVAINYVANPSQTVTNSVIALKP